MAIKVIMPQMGESVVEGKMAKWPVKEGDPIEADQPIAEVSTDKVDIEISSPGAGTLVKIYVLEGATASVGAEFALIGEGNEAKRQTAQPPSRVLPPTVKPPIQTLDPSRKSAKPPVEERHSEAEAGRISPLVKKMAEQYQVDLRQVSRSGIGGRITKQDLLRYVGKKEALPVEAAPFPPKAAHQEAAPKPAAPPVPGKREFTEYQIPHYKPKKGDQIIPFPRLRKMIAEHMGNSKRTTPHVTAVAEVDMARVVGLRNQMRELIKNQTGQELTFLPFVISATVEAVADYPVLNASVVDDRLIIRKEINIGIAVETNKGLMVPVIRQAQGRSLTGLARAAAKLAAKAREGNLTPDEITGGSFTISNPGRKGNLFGTPVIFQPQVGILTMGEIVKRPVVIEVEGTDTIAVRPMMYLALSYDHRVIDGATGNLFLHRVKNILEKGSFQF